MTIFPMHLKEANEFVKAIHRHHGPVVGYKFALGAAVKTDFGAIREAGVAISGRPVARRLDDKLTLEVLRLAVLSGEKNACSFLYGASARTAKELGYADIITYVLDSETGVSLKASGWHICGETDGGSWSVPSRPRVDKHPTCPKVRWHRILRRRHSWEDANRWCRLSTSKLPFKDIA